MCAPYSECVTCKLLVCLSIPYTLYKSTGNGYVYQAYTKLLQCPFRTSIRPGKIKSLALTQISGAIKV